MLIPRSSCIAPAAQAYDPGTGFSVTPSGAIGFSQDIENRLSAVSLAAAPVQPEMPSTSSSSSSNSQVTSNRDAYNRMRISCQSIVPETSSKKQHLSLPYGCGNDKEEEYEDSFMNTGEGMSGWGSVMQGGGNDVLMTGAVSRAVKNARKLVLNPLGRTLTVEEAELQKVANDVFLCHNIKESFYAWHKSEEGQKAMQGKTRLNIFKILTHVHHLTNWLSAENQDKDKDALTLQKAVDDLKNAWLAKFHLQIINFGTYKYWKKTVAEQAASNSEAKKQCEENMKVFATFMTMYAAACPIAQRLHDRLVKIEKYKEDFQPEDYKVLSDKGVTNALRHLKVPKSRRKKSAACIPNDPSNTMMMGAAYDSLEDEDDAMHGPQTSGDFCQCGPHAIPVPMYSGAPMGNFCQCGPHAIPVPMYSGAPIGMGDVCRCKNPVPVPIETGLGLEEAKRAIGSMHPHTKKNGRGNGRQANGRGNPSWQQYGPQFQWYGQWPTNGRGNGRRSFGGRGGRPYRNNGWKPYQGPREEFEPSYSMPALPTSSTTAAAKSSGKRLVF